MNKLVPQKGGVTLVMSLMMLLIVSGVTFMTSAAFKEQARLTGDDFRDKQAYEAAMSGMAVALDYLDSDQSATAYSNAPVSGSTSSGAYKIYYCEPDDEAFSSTGCGESKVYDEDEGRVLIFVEGTSLDGEGVRKISGLVAGRAGVNINLSAPISGGNAISVGGSADITNNYGRTSIWTGETATLSNSRETLVLPPEENAGEAIRIGAQIASGDNSESLPSMVIGSNSERIGSDVVDQDKNLADATLADFYSHFLGMSQADYSAVASNDDLSDVPGVGPDGEADTADDDNNFYFISSGLIFNNGDSKDDGSTIWGDATNPAVIVIDGDLQLNGNVTINGILFVTGELTGNGTATINGGAVIYGDVDFSGNIAINYNPILLSNTSSGNGEVALIGGTWKDWL